VNGIGIPTRDTSAMTPADSSQILIRPADSSLYVRYKRAWQKVGAGGTIGGSGTTNYIPKFTSSTAIGNSQIFDDGTDVLINTTTFNNGGLSVSASGLNINKSVPIMLMRESGTGNTFYNGIALGRSYIGSENNIPIVFLTNNLERVKIDSTGNVGIGYTAPAAKLAVNGTALINTNTDNGVDRLQVSGSAVATVLKATGTGNNLAILNGTGTTNAYIDFQNAGTTQWRAGNDYNGGSRLFRINDVAGSVNTMLVNSSNQIGFNMPTTSFLGSNSALEFHKAGGQGIMRYFTYSNSVPGVSFETRTTKTNTPGSYAATTNGDVILEFSGLGSSNSAYVNAGYFGLYQNGTTSTRVPANWIFAASSASTADIARFYVDGGNNNVQFWTNSTQRMTVASSGAVLINTTTDNNVDELQVNGSIQGAGFNQAYTARTTTYTAANTDYFIDCTSGTFTVNLFTAVGNTGRILIIKNSGTGTITVDPNGSQTIDGATTQSLATQWSRVHIISDGANWKIISN
jgi:hypothetical protein